MTGIAIIDYDMANLRSVQKGFEAVGYAADIVRDPDDIANYEKIVLPGVGAFQDAVATLRDRKLAGPIIQHIKAGKPFLGICLGLQMLFDVGYEDGEHAGLGIFRGKCIRFDVDEKQNLKVPHMGWNQLIFSRANPSRLFDGLGANASVYFVHSYHVVPEDVSIIAATTDYGGAFVSSIRKDNIFATQFHPEKSQKVGLQILKNFAGMPGNMGR